MELKSQYNKTKSAQLGRFVFAVACSIVILAQSSACFAGRKAFVVAIENYHNIKKLSSPLMDAKNVIGTLHDLGYEITPVLDEDATQRNLGIKWEKFVKSLADNDDMVVYYSGHGIQIASVDYIVPIDAYNMQQANEDEDVLATTLTSLSNLIKALGANGKARTAIWIFNACRSSPFEREGKSYPKLAQMGVLQGTGSLGVLYAASIGQDAQQSAPSDPKGASLMSLFTRFLVPEIQQKAHSDIHDIFRDVKKLINDATGNVDQRPSYLDQIAVDPWCFSTCTSTALQWFNTNTRFNWNNWAYSNNLLSPITQQSNLNHQDQQIFGGEHSTVRLALNHARIGDDWPSSAGGWAGGGLVMADAGSLGRHLNYEGRDDNISLWSHGRFGQSESSSASTGIGTNPWIVLFGQSERTSASTGIATNPWNVPSIISLNTTPTASEFINAYLADTSGHNAVFIGKASSADCKDDERSYRLPFGCNIVKKLSGFDYTAYGGQKLTAVMDVNILVAALKVAEGEDGIHKCVVANVKAGDSVNLDFIARLDYPSGEAIFWGLVLKPQKGCM